MELSIDKNLKDRTLPAIATRNRMSIVGYFLTGVLVSCYFFPFEFMFLPAGLNTKIILAVTGVFLLGLNGIREKSIRINQELVPAIILAVCFSVWGYIAMDVNNSNDQAYASYWVSFSTWLLGAYTTIAMIRYTHGYASLTLLFHYLIAVCVAQCILALVIDNSIPFKAVIDEYISQRTVAEVEFLNTVDRLYGIGAAVDVAGTRFSIVLIGLAAIIIKAKDTKRGPWRIVAYWCSFVILCIVGNMMSRTTTTGMVIALLYILVSSQLFSREISIGNLKLWRTIVLVTAIMIAIAVYFYQTDDAVKEQLRFGFEGFFNWFERGAWTTSSTDRLNAVMWIWPDVNDHKTWLVGKALFSNWHDVGTDIGYCRFIFYSGLPGLATFTLFFIYNAWAGAQKFPNYSIFFIMLLSLTFIIWVKVATDLFLIYALFYCLDREGRTER